MNLVEELRKLQELHRSGALTDAEFAAAKAAVLAGAAGQPDDAYATSPRPRPAPRPDDRHDAVEDELVELRRQTELLRLDQEWDREREAYFIAGKYGHRRPPSYATGVFAIAVAVVFGGLWTAFTASMMGGGNMPMPFGLFPLFGLVFIVFGVGTGAYQIYRANQYQEAEAAYRSRRQRLVAGQGEYHDLRRDDD